MVKRYSLLPEPLRQPLFRRIWLAGLLSNLGLLIQGVGAAWAMVQMSVQPQLVALVQTSLMIPTMLLSLPGGALADMYDRRKVALAALCQATISATCLALFSYAGLLNPVILLLFCLLLGCSWALFNPAWQASVGEQVPAELLPAAVSLNSVSYNIARSLGPAIGGVIVSIGGSICAFIINAALYLPLITVLFRWNRSRDIPRLPPEKIVEAVGSGLRYVIHSPAIRTVLVRTICLGLSGGSILALMPLIAKNVLGGGAQLYGFMLGLFGIGAVTGALALPTLRSRLSVSTLVNVSTFAMVITLALIGESNWLAVSSIALPICGCAWLLLTTQFNIAIQMSAPRWVTGRALATFQAAISGSVALGAWFWGLIADKFDVGIAMLASAVTMAVLSVANRWLPIPEVAPDVRQSIEPSTEPKAVLPLTLRSGPIIITVEYHIDPDDARSFYALIQEFQLARRRNGARDWSIARDVDDPRRWIERFQCATWLDFLRLRDRPTLMERELQRRITAFQSSSTPIRVTRMLGRPLGSVRWREETPDPKQDPIASTGVGGA